VLEGGFDLERALRGMGLTVEWLAEYLERAPATVQSWVDGFHPVPGDLQAVVDEIQATADDLADKMVQDARAAFARQAVQTGRPSMGGVYRMIETDAELWKAHPEFHPYPASFYRAIAQRANAALAEQGYGASSPARVN